MFMYSELAAITSIMARHESQTIGAYMIKPATKPFCDEVVACQDMNTDREVDAEVAGTLNLIRPVKAVSIGSHRDMQIELTDAGRAMLPAMLAAVTWLATTSGASSSWAEVIGEYDASQRILKATSAMMRNA